MTRPVPPMYRAVAGLLRPLLRVTMRRDWRGAEHLPVEGGFIAAGNHLTNVDPLVFAHYLYNHGAAPRFLAKHTLFAVPVVGWVLRQAGQIPVERDSASAVAALEPARQSLAQGLCVGIFPEGTFTRDPHLWPMTARLGVARLALSARVPVVPVAQWGPQDVLARYGKVPHLFPRRTVRVQAGPPVPLDDLYGREDDPHALREATERVMAAVTQLLAGLRGEQPPARVYDTRRDGDPRAAELLARYGKVPHLFPRRTVRVQAGPPVPLEDLYGREDDPRALREATERVMAAVTQLLAGLRGEQPPARVYDTRRDGDPRAAELAARAERRRAERRRAERRRAGRAASRRGGHRTAPTASPADERDA